MFRRHFAVGSIAGILPDPLVVCHSGIILHKDELEPDDPTLTPWIKEALGNGQWLIPRGWELISGQAMEALPIQLQTIASPIEVAGMQQQVGVAPKPGAAMPKLYQTDDEVEAGLRLEIFSALSNILADEPKLFDALYRALRWKNEGARITALFSPIAIHNGELCLADNYEPLSKVLHEIENQYPFSLILCLGRNWPEDVFIDDSYRCPQLISSIAFMHGNFLNRNHWRDMSGFAILPGSKMSHYRHEMLKLIEQLP